LAMVQVLEIFLPPPSPSGYWKPDSALNMCLCIDKTLKLFSQAVLDPTLVDDSLQIVWTRYFACINLLVTRVSKINIVTHSNELATRAKWLQAIRCHWQWPVSRKAHQQGTPSRMANRCMRYWRCRPDADPALSPSFARSHQCPGQAAQPARCAPTRSTCSQPWRPCSSHAYMRRTPAPAWAPALGSVT
jgi:hypothetical protein